MNENQRSAHHNQIQRTEKVYRHVVSELAHGDSNSQKIISLIRLPISPVVIPGVGRKMGSFFQSSQPLGSELF